MKRFAPLLAPILLACSSLLFAAPAVEHLRLSVIPTAVSSGAAEAMVVSGGRWTTERHLVHAAVLIEHPKGRFLFDTGLGRQTAEAFARNNWINRCRVHTLRAQASPPSITSWAAAAIDSARF